MPDADAAGVAGWASAYLVGRADADAVSPGDAAWAVLSLAWDHSGEDAARSLYADLHAAAAVASPAANGQLALAAAAVSRTADIATYADRIAASLTRDTEAPSATWTATGGTTWAGGDPLRLTRTALADDLWPAASLTQTVTWGDGSTTAVGASTTTISHRYRTTGARTVRVTVSDPSGNTRTSTVATITVRADDARPTVAVVRPDSARARSAWNPVVLRAADARSGISSVQVRLRVKRGSGWYRFTGTAWTKGNATPWVAAARASGSRWKLDAGTPPRGRLVVVARSTDVAGNRSRLDTVTVGLSR